MVFFYISFTIKEEDSDLTLFKCILFMYPDRAVEEAFYEKKDLDPSMHAHAAGKTVEFPTDVDAELLAKVLSNPEMAVLLTSLAKSMQGEHN